MLQSIMLKLGCTFAIKDLKYFFITFLYILFFYYIIIIKFDIYIYIKLIFLKLLNTNHMISKLINSK